MKKLTLTVASLLFCGFLMAQDFTPPAKAIAAFSAKYPDGTVQEWYEGYQDIECYFENDGQYGSAHFSQSGTWLSSEITIDESELPRAVAETLGEDFEGYEITDVTYTVTPKSQQYAINILNDVTEDNRIVTYDETGDLIDEVVVDSEDDSTD
ncbi:MAG: hypothetical protein Crog4KO_02920 [Crocinitomicaceae bacterium]